VKTPRFFANHAASRGSPRVPHRCTRDFVSEKPSVSAGHDVADGGEEEAHHGGAAELHLQVLVLRGRERVAVGEALVGVRDANPLGVPSMSK
jgi:hypothetical protein